jgi:hypothetical protein
MVHVCNGDDKKGISLPLLIGEDNNFGDPCGGEDSPSYNNTVVHVKDASKQPALYRRYSRGRIMLFR